MENNADIRRLWATPEWLPTEIAIVPHGRSVLCVEGEALQDLRKSRPDIETLVYELVGMVADINSGEQQKSHLVSLVNSKPFFLRTTRL